jgi:hypothetical protein
VPELLAGPRLRVRLARAAVARVAFALGAFGLMALELAGCGTPALPCPAAKVLRETDRVVRFAPADTPEAGKIQYIAQIADAKLNCSYDPNTYEKLTVVMGVQITVARGPVSGPAATDFEYFVAVVNLEGQILGKKIFPLHIEFPPGQNEVSKVEEIDQRIPLKYPQNGSGIEIWTGFQLTDAELKFNREHFQQ